MRLTAENLAAERGGERVFSGVGFALADGDCLVVTGPNGAGKSTLLRVVAGLLPAAEGTVRLAGGSEAFPDLSSAAHYLGHLNGMKTALGVAENLAFWRAFLGEPRLAIDEALAMVGLAGTGSLPFGYLSTGQRRRAAIARLLVSHRPIWILDEPAAGLDAASERQLANLLQKHLDDGGIVLAATHAPLGVAGAKGVRLGEAQDV